MAKKLTSLELCAGAGGQALGLEMAGFEHVALVEIDKDASATLRLNRPNWNTLNLDLKAFDASGFEGVDLVAGGVPCPPSQKPESSWARRTKGTSSTRRSGSCVRPSPAR